MVGVVSIHLLVSVADWVRSLIPRLPTVATKTQFLFRLHKVQLHFYVVGMHPFNYEMEVTVQMHNA